ncbi:hypothetical protein HPB49_003693 [Dermacentor silvarum]|uniref:Uncharacterized protein n=1 Tax=Dermacentor silvarum TaxID=543639 RepID=A0ACB8DU68_DERSI|nr:hypothetical protein HPB49_003693 [Dermacentor silvarum]
MANPGVYLIGDSGHPLDPRLLTPLPDAEGKYNTTHAAMRSVVERCIGLLMSRFRCLQRYRTLSTSQNVRPTLSLNVLCCAYNLRLSEGDKDNDDESDDDSSTCSSSELDNNGDLIPHGLPRNRGVSKCSQQQLQEVLIRPLRPPLLLKALLLYVPQAAHFLCQLPQASHLCLMVRFAKK